MARPLTFNPDEKLHLAMMLFWRQGYEATSIENLVDELEINRFSLYNTFGDKQALFIRAIELYEKKVFSRLLQTLQPVEEGLPRLHVYFDALSAGLKSQSVEGGCFLQNSLLEGGIEDRKILLRLRKIILRLRNTLNDVIENARKQGQIASDSDSSALTDFLLLQVQGLIVLHGLKMEKQADCALDILKQQIRRW
jgi:TetR/AcrR family transcriptional regulator, transcriptional repressor for nem operon